MKDRIGSRRYLEGVDALLIDARQALESATLGLSAAYEIDKNEAISEAEEQIVETIERLDAIGIRVRRAGHL